MDKITKTISDIKKIKIQGAEAVARACVSAIMEYVQTLRKESPEKFLKLLVEKTFLLGNARPTEPLARNSLRYLLESVEKKFFPNGKSASGGETKKMATTEELIVELVCKADIIEAKMKEVKEQLINHGAKLIAKKTKFLTHCHSTSAESILLSGTEAMRKARKVFTTETRPLYQGRKTVKDLAKGGLNATLIIDSAAPFILSGGFGKFVTPEVVLIGADAILPDGSVINKVGSYGIALSAWKNKIPVYSVAGLLKSADYDQIIELRKEAEIVFSSPNFDVFNPAFDKVPAKLVTGIICEAGVVKPRDFKTTAYKKYSWLK